MKLTSKFSKEVITRNNLIYFIKLNMRVSVINLMKDFFFKLFE